MLNKVAALLDSWNIGYRIEDEKLIVRGSKWKINVPPVNEELAYLLGFVWGDGCLVKPQPRKTGGNRLRVNICFSGSAKGKTQAQYICETIKRFFHYEPRVRNRQRKNRKDWQEVDVNSTVIYAYFCYLGLPIGKKYGKLEVPPAVRSESLFKKFLTGLVDADGYTTRKGKVWIVQKDRKFLHQIRDLSLKFLKVNFSSPRPNSKIINGKIYTWYYIIASESHLRRAREMKIKT